MTIVAKTIDQGQRVEASATTEWPDRHPRGKPQTCNICGNEARPYTCGPRCDNHSPAAMRKAAQP